MTHSLTRKGQHSSRRFFERHRRKSTKECSQVFVSLSVSNSLWNVDAASRRPLPLPSLSFPLGSEELFRGLLLRYDVLASVLRVVDCDCCEAALHYVLRLKKER